MTKIWKYDNTLIKYGLREADRSRFILPNPNLSNDQKKEVIDFFKVHNEAGNNIPWQSNAVKKEWGYDDFKQHMQVKQKNLIKSNSRQLRKSSGLDSLEKGKDYIIIEDNEDYTSYYPRNHRASRIIASNMVEPKLWCESAQMKWSPKEILPDGEHMKGDLFPGAKWCISMETPEHWDEFTEENADFLMVCYKDKNLEDRYKKKCFALEDYKVMHDLTVDASDTPFDFTPLDKRACSAFLKFLHKPHDEGFSKNLRFNPTTKKYDYEGSIYVAAIPSLIKDGKFTIPFGKVTGSFICIGLDSLKSLEGAPDYVGKNFKCDSCPSLTSLEGSPRVVGNDFICIECNSLTSLKGGPEEVGGNFICTDCESLISLKGGPKKVMSYFNCDRLPSLRSLEGCPTKVYKAFWCTDCNSLISLKGAPEEIGGNFTCDDCANLISLEGVPQRINGNFSCKNCHSIKDFSPLNNCEIKGEIIQ